MNVYGSNVLMLFGNWTSTANTSYLNNFTTITIPWGQSAVCTNNGESYTYTHIPPTYVNLIVGDKYEIENVINSNGTSWLLGYGQEPGITYVWNQDGYYIINVIQPIAIANTPVYEIVNVVPGYQFLDTTSDDIIDISDDNFTYSNGTIINIPNDVIITTSSNIIKLVPGPQTIVYVPTYTFYQTDIVPSRGTYITNLEINGTLIQNSVIFTIDDIGTFTSGNVQFIVFLYTPVIGSLSPSGYLKSIGNYYIYSDKILYYQSPNTNISTSTNTKSITYFATQKIAGTPVLPGYNVSLLYLDKYTFETPTGSGSIDTSSGSLVIYPPLVQTVSTTDTIPSLSIEFDTMYIFPSSTYQISIDGQSTTLFTTPDSENNYTLKPSSTTSTAIPGTVITVKQLSSSSTVIRTYLCTYLGKPITEELIGVSTLHNVSLIISTNDPISYTGNLPNVSISITSPVVVTYENNYYSFTFSSGTPNNFTLEVIKKNKHYIYIYQSIANNMSVDVIVGKTLEFPPGYRLKSNITVTTQSYKFNNSGTYYITNNSNVVNIVIVKSSGTAKSVNLSNNLIIPVGSTVNNMFNSVITTVGVTQTSNSISFTFPNVGQYAITGPNTINVNVLAGSSSVNTTIFAGENYTYSYQLSIIDCNVDFNGVVYSDPTDLISSNVSNINYASNNPYIIYTKVNSVYTYTFYNMPLGQSTFTFSDGFLLTLTVVGQYFHINVITHETFITEFPLINLPIAMTAVDINLFIVRIPGIYYMEDNVGNTYKIIVNNQDRRIGGTALFWFTPNMCPPGLLPSSNYTMYIVKTTSTMYSPNSNNVYFNIDISNLPFTVVPTYIKKYTGVYSETGIENQNEEFNLPNIPFITGVGTQLNSIQDIATQATTSLSNFMNYAYITGRTVSYINNTSSGYAPSIYALLLNGTKNPSNSDYHIIYFCPMRDFFYL